AGNIVTWPHQALDPLYVWDNTLNATNAVSAFAMYTDNQDYYQQFGPGGESGSFNGTAGVGQGSANSKPSTCTPGVGYWATDTNTLYVCNPTNTWTIYYTPHIYPHPLVSGTPPPTTTTTTTTT